MNFLLKMNLPRQLGRLFKGAGHDFRHVADIGMAAASDDDIIEEARSRGETILTHDLDCGHLLAFSGEASPSVIIFRVRNTQAANLFSRVVSAWTDIEQPLREGAIVAIEDASVRIRRLPIR